MVEIIDRQFEGLQMLITFITEVIQSKAVI